LSPQPDSDELRAAVFTYVDELVGSGSPYVTRAQLSEFHFRGERFPLIDPSKGIRKPAGWSTVLSILSTQTPADRGGYDDDVRDDGSVVYRFMRPAASDASATNSALLGTMDRGEPILYLIEVATSTYEPVYPVWFRGREGEAVVVSDVGPTGEYADIVDLRRYQKVVGKRRLHQEEFRARVLFAYEDRCCICRLGRRGLLDAAHIVDDADLSGLAIVPNGLSMCRIHHAAYDQYLIGVRPDLKIEVAPDVLREEDGPMLRHGLQEIAGNQIRVPSSRRAQPDPDRLEWKYERFLAAG
jgi:putative restriction endonuclease